MSLVSTRRLEPLERWSPSLFLVAGPMVLVVVGIETIGWFTGVAVPEIAYWPLFPVGLALSLTGVVGLYPRLAEGGRRVATLGAVLGLFGVVSLLGGTVVLLVTAPPGPYPRSLGPLGLSFLLGLLAFVPVAGIYGALSLRTASESPTVGAFLLALSLGQGSELAAALFVFPLAGGSPGVFYFVFEIVAYSVLATFMVAVGYSLRTDLASTGHVDPVGTTT